MKMLGERRGLAGGAAEVMSDTPLQILSRPLYVPRETEPELKLKRWEVPVARDDAETSSEELGPFERIVDINHYDLGWEDRAFRNMLAKHAEFAIGGIRTFTRFGVKAAWLRDQEVRERARDLIKARGWWPLLTALRYKENNPEDMIGLRDITHYWRAAVDPTEPAWDENGTAAERQRNRRTTTLKLRKAIELICSLEVVLDERWKQSPHQMQDAHEKLTGQTLQDPTGMFVWDILWLEPIIYSVSPRPRRGDVGRILKFAGRKFEATSGQTVKSLYRVLAGATCSWKTASRAAEFCNLYYGFNDSKKIGGRLAQTRAVSARPAEYRIRMGLATDEKDPFSFVRISGDISAFSDAPAGACTTFYESFGQIMDAPFIAPSASTH